MFPLSWLCPLPLYTNYAHLLDLFWISLPRLRLSICCERQT